MSRLGWLQTALVCLTTAVGFSLSRMISPPLGADHSCPPGSTPASCHYPADQAGWTAWWTIGGLALGVAVVLAIHAIRYRRHDRGMTEQ
jgi:heme/copper-type cytochrome/quinol oxidase subunit 2